MYLTWPKLETSGLQSGLRDIFQWKDECHRYVSEELLCPGWVVAVMHGSQGNIDEAENLTQPVLRRPMVHESQASSVDKEGASQHLITVQNKCRWWQWTMGPVAMLM